MPAMCRRRPRARRIAVVVLSPLVVAATGCGRRGGDEPRDGLAADTARFSYGDRTVEVPLTACGRDGDVVLLAGRAGSVVLQAAADLGDGGTDRTGVTADLGIDGIVGAFGADVDHGPAGDIADVRAEGDRVIIEGTWVALDAELEPTALAGAPADVTGELVARCPDADDGTAAHGEVMGSDSERSRSWVPIPEQKTSGLRSWNP